MEKLDDKRVVFFDMDNTLLYFHNHPEYEEQMEEMGIENLHKYLQEIFPEMTLDELVEGFIRPWYSAMGQRPKSKNEPMIDELLNSFVSKYDGYLGYPACINAMRAYYQPMMSLIDVKKETYDVLKTLKDHGYEIAVIANTSYFADLMQECFEFVGLGDCIDKYFFSYDLGVRKPSQEIFEYALRRMGVFANEAIMVGDSLYHDMAPAQLVGMDCIWVTEEEDNYMDVSLLKKCDKIEDILSVLLVEEVEEDEEEYDDYFIESDDFMDDEW